MKKVLSWCSRQVLSGWVVIQWALMVASIGLIIAAAVVTFVNYIGVILQRWAI